MRTLSVFSLCSAVNFRFNCCFCPNVLKCGSFAFYLPLSKHRRNQMCMFDIVQLHLLCSNIARAALNPPFCGLVLVLLQHFGFKLSSSSRISHIYSCVTGVVIYDQLRKYDIRFCCCIAYHSQHVGSILVGLTPFIAAVNV